MEENTMKKIKQKCEKYIEKERNEMKLKDLLTSVGVGKKESKEYQKGCMGYDLMLIENGMDLQLDEIYPLEVCLLVFPLKTVLRIELPSGDC